MPWESGRPSCSPGTANAPAAAIAAEVGVDAYRAEVLPEDKARFVTQEQAKATR